MERCMCGAEDCVWCFPSLLRDEDDGSREEHEYEQGQLRIEREMDGDYD